MSGVQKMEVSLSFCPDLYYNQPQVLTLPLCLFLAELSRSAGWNATRKLGSNLELSLLLLKQITAMMLMVMAGFVMAKVKLINGEESRILSRTVVNIICPCAFGGAFLVESSPEIRANLLASFVAASLIYAAFCGVTWLLSHGRYALTPGEQAAVVYSNSGNLIFPIILSTLGAEFVVYSCAYVAIQNLLTWSHGQLLLGGTQKLTVWKVVTNPCIFAILLGITVFLTGIQLPAPVVSAVDSMGACLGPLSMLIIGIMLAETDLKQAFSSLRTYRVIALRLGVYPLISIGILWVLGRIWPIGTDIGMTLTVPLLCSIGPSSTTLTQMAQLYQHPERGYMSSINAVTTILCAATMPVMLFIYQLFSA